MFAIELTSLTLPEIYLLDIFTNVDKVELEIYVRSARPWYFVRGYVNSSGALEPWAVFPEDILRRSYDYDPDKIHTDWDQIVRK